MIFKGTPLMLVRHGITHKMLFRFDKDGLADTKGRGFDKKIIARLKKQFEVVEEEKLKEVEVLTSLQCKVCGFIAKTKFGLNSHKRKHK